MIYSVETSAKIIIKEYYVVRFIVDRGAKGYEVIHEETLEHEPTNEEVAKFLVECGCCDFVSVIKNYKLLK